MTPRNPADYGIKELRALCQATAPNPKKESKLGRFTRVFSIYFTYLFLRLPFTPNHISLISVAVFFLGLFMYASPRLEIQLLGPAFYFLSIILDGVDGEVARFRNAQSIVGGQYLEPVSHDLMYSLFFLLLGIFAFEQGGSIWLLYAGITASLAKVLSRSLETRFWMIVYLGTKHEDKNVQNAIADTRPWLLQQFDFWNKNIYSYPAIVGPLLIATYFQRMDLFLYFYAASFVGLFLPPPFEAELLLYDAHTPKAVVEHVQKIHIRRYATLENTHRISNTPHVSSLARLVSGLFEHALG